VSLTTSPELPFLAAGYLLLFIFFVIERTLRQPGVGSTLQRGAFDKRTTLTVGVAFGVCLTLPLVALLVAPGIFQISLFEGIAGLIIMISGLVLRIWAAKTLGRFYTRTLIIASGQNVISTGPYSRIRHPGYLGSILLWVGFSIMTGNAVLEIVYPVVFIAVYLHRISVEEAMLVKELGQNYIQYKNRTKRILPFFY
jgi:protein-S-isoprenylcysteine O-methyltransferase Ste14